MLGRSCSQMLLPTLLWLVYGWASLKRPKTHQSKLRLSSNYAQAHVAFSSDAMRLDAMQWCKAVRSHWFTTDRTMVDTRISTTFDCLSDVHYYCRLRQLQRSTFSRKKPHRTNCGSWLNTFHTRHDWCWRCTHIRACTTSVHTFENPKYKGKWSWADSSVSKAAFIHQSDIYKCSLDAVSQRTA